MRLGGYTVKNQTGQITVVWTCEKRGGRGGIQDGGKNAGDGKQTAWKTKGNVGTVSTGKYEKEEIEKGAGIGSKGLEKVDCRTTDVREEGEKRDSLQTKVRRMVLTFMGLQERVCVHMGSEIIMSPTPVKGKYGL